MLLLLSTLLSVPTSRRPTSRGLTPWRSSRRRSAVSARDTTSSRSPTNASPCCPSPTVYLPLGAPSCRSRSSCRTCTQRQGGLCSTEEGAAGSTWRQVPAVPSGGARGCSSLCGRHPCAQQPSQRLTAEVREPIMPPQTALGLVDDRSRGERHNTRSHMCWESRLPLQGCPRCSPGWAAPAPWHRRC